MARPIRPAFGYTMTVVAAGAGLHDSSVGKILTAWETAKFTFQDLTPFVLFGLGLAAVGLIGRRRRR